MLFKNLVNVGVSVQPFGKGDSVQCAYQVGRGKAAKFFGFAVHLRRLALWLGQFRPDGLPIVGAKLLARYCAFGDLLNGCAVLYRDRTLSLPICDGLLRDSEFADNERPHSMLVKGVYMFHAGNCTS